MKASPGAGFSPEVGSALSPAVSPTVSPAAGEPEFDAAIAAPERLRALRRTDLLLDGPESTYERITRLAAALLKVPAAFITLVGAEGEVRKGSIGMEGHPPEDPAPGERRDGLPATGHSLCHYTIAAASPLLIEDIAADPLYGKVESARSMGLGAYAGVPLVLEGTQAIGSLCAVDFAPRAWSALDAEVLTELARAITREIELRVAMDDAVAALDLTQRTLRERDEAVSNLAHDLRSPLSAISISAVGLSRRPEPEIKNYAAIQTRGAKQMTQLIEDMRVSTSGLPLPEPRSRLAVRCELLLADVLHSMRAAAEARGILLTVDNPQGLPAVAINYPQVMRVFANLVGNSIAYSAAGTVVHVGAELEGSFVRFSITDQGPGIPEEFHQRVFDRHWQVERGLSKGHGLGLAVSRLFVEENGGSIAIRKGSGPEAPPAPALDLGNLDALPSMEALAAAEAAPQGPGIGAILNFTLPVATL
ncbi:MAG TPA: GAF domain-containing sensor histidine kinase [Burkholderiales bacterium]|nr:GAF domain-containing sensor histidine kinase [Burkholderiales bacterium]